MQRQKLSDRIQEDFHMEALEKQYVRLEEHTISGVEYLAPRARYPRLHGKNAIRGYHGFGGTVEAVRLHTDRGACGWASISGSYQAAKEAKELILGRKLTDIFRPDIGILANELLPFDLALHDLAGRILEIPVCRMIKPEAAQSVRVYDGAIYMNDIIPEDRPMGIDKILEDCAGDYELGYRDMKVKVGRGHQWMGHKEGLLRDIEVVREISRSFPQVRLLADANDGYTLEDCYAFLTGIGDVSLYWFEEPFRESVADNTKLKEFMRLHTPATLLADGESMTDIPLLFELAEKRLLDIWMPDVCDYGFTAWRKLLKELEQLGYLGSPHAWGQVLKTHYCAHLAAAYPQNVPIIEGVLGNTEGVNDEAYKVTEGIMKIPMTPGFGMDLVWAPNSLR